MTRSREAVPSIQEVAALEARIERHILQKAIGVFGQISDTQRYSTRAYYNRQDDEIVLTAVALCRNELVIEYEQTPGNEIVGVRHETITDTHLITTRTRQNKRDPYSKAYGRYRCLRQIEEELDKQLMEKHVEYLGQKSAV